MDLITQGLVGATVAQASAKPNEIRLASLIGFCAPLLADADALLRSSEDPLLFLENHRHFTHALAFIPVGALIAAALLWLVLRKQLTFGKVYVYALLGYATAGFMDACTSYGTHLFWPFNNDRIAWSIISIFDPLFSLGLIVALALGLVKHNAHAAKIGLAFAGAYLLLGTTQHQRAETLAYAQAEERNHSVVRLIVKPTIGNLLLWRSVYESDSTYYVDAVRVGLPNNSKVFEGAMVPAFDVRRELPQLSPQSIVYQDIKRFEVFSDGFLAWHPELPDVIGDVRYAMLPTSIRPLWGIELNLDAPNEHVKFDNYRSMSDTEREAFISMLLNR